MFCHGSGKRRNGKLITKEIETEKLKVTDPQGITISDKKGQVGCLSVEDVTTGAISVAVGACGSSPSVTNNSIEVSPAVAGETSATTTEVSATTTATSTEP